MTVTHLEQLLYSAALPLLLTAGGTFALIKWGEAKFWHALLFLVGGFYLAKSPVAPYIETFLGRIPGLFGWHPHLPAVHLTTPQSALALAAWLTGGPA